jgi:hypothetical protein
VARSSPLIVGTPSSLATVTQEGMCATHIEREEHYELQVLEESLDNVVKIVSGKKSPGSRKQRFVKIGKRSGKNREKIGKLKKIQKYSFFFNF